jgi:hypothetical protein
VLAVLPIALKQLIPSLFQEAACQLLACGARLVVLGHVLKDRDRNPARALPLKA